MSWQVRQESKRVKREKTVVWRWLLQKSLTRNLRIQTEFVPDIVSEKVIISQQRAIVGDQVVLIKTCHYWIYLILQHNSTETSCCEHFKWVKIQKLCHIWSQTKCLQQIYSAILLQNGSLGKPFENTQILLLYDWKQKWWKAI